MKKKFILIFFLLPAIISSSFACEICGCGVGNYYIGLLPQFKSRFIGFRYHYKIFNTRLANDPSQFSKDFYQTTELWSGWNINRRFQMLTLIPVSFNHQNSDEGTNNRSGLSDMVILINYKILDLNTKTSGNNSISQQLWIGGGLKLPTGKYKIDTDDADMVSMANMQPGSGSADFLMHGMYNIKIDKIGFVFQGNYKINGTNNDDFRFGDKLTVNSFFTYSFISPKTIISPNIGLQYEKTDPSKLQSSKIDLSGGSQLQAAAGIEFAFNKVSLGFNSQLPITQNFAENQTKQKIKGMTHISFTF